LKGIEILEFNNQFWVATPPPPGEGDWAQTRVGLPLEERRMICEVGLCPGGSGWMFLAPD